MDKYNGKILTISIAAYNAEKYIAGCLDSLCEESIIDKLDIIVVNDGSHDATEEVAQKYVEKYPKSIRHIREWNWLRESILSFWMLMIGISLKI